VGGAAPDIDGDAFLIPRVGPSHAGGTDDAAEEAAGSTCPAGNGLRRFSPRTPGAVGHTLMVDCRHVRRSDVRPPGDLAL